ncbi:MAG TPA: zf-HC2 domain-containing protein [Kofleriaceae bacterium]|nr:zf-HC2 domain-containing protein [Kofleriaceae bacterium]
MKRAEELLAAYADGGLAPDEAAEVEALLAASPEARAELEAIRRLLGDARGAAGGAAEPDWDSMARSIQRACDEAPPPRLAWLWRPRRVLAIGGLVAAATAAVLFVALGRGEEGAGGRAPQAAAEPSPPATAAAPEAPAGSQEPLPALREPELDELSADELAVLDDELATGDLGDEGFIADLLAPAGEAADEDGFAVFDDHPLTADELAEELPPDAIEKLDRFLAEVSAG